MMPSDQDLRRNPLSYPGAPITEAGVLLDRRFHPGMTASLDDRQPILCVGSNASVRQLRWKLSALAGPVVVPFTPVIVRDLLVGVSAHVSSAGYLPATPVPAPGEGMRSVVIWLDERQQQAVDATEPNYDRLPLSPTATPIRTLRPHSLIAGCQAYVSRHGHLVDSDGLPRRLVAQPDLIATLVAASAALRRLAGQTPEQFVAAMCDPALREQVRDVYRAEGWIRQP